jgi:hypothetical protein
VAILTFLAFPEPARVAMVLELAGLLKAVKGPNCLRNEKKKHPNRVGKNSSGKLCVWNTIKIKKERVNEGRRIYFYLVKE